VSMSMHSLRGSLKYKKNLRTHARDDAWTFSRATMGHIAIHSCEIFTLQLIHTLIIAPMITLTA
jgi:steroid 5-alpha reductase family enzyme